MKRLVILTITVFIFLTLFLALKSNAAIMEDYCQVPPYVIQNVAPNVMIVLDNSGSMLRFAYFDGFNTVSALDDILCDNIASPCSGFTNPGTYPGYKYYGYFNPDYWYTYSNNRFNPAALKTAARPANSWDGNFLNWMTMRRADIIRKVLAGGKSTGSGANTRLLGQRADGAGRGIYKQIANAQDYTPYSGNRTFTFGTGGSSASSFSVSGSGDTFDVVVVVPPPVEGILQEVVGARARLGLSFYRANTPTPHGGFVQVNVASGSLSSVVNQINNDPSSYMGTTNTPLAETLWTMTGYFAQQATIESGPGPMYGPQSNYTINDNADPFNYGTGGQTRYPFCAKSFILLITDGEPCYDGYLPATITNYAAGKSDYNCAGIICPAVGSFPASSLDTYPCSGDYVAGVEDVALYMHTTDLRNQGGTPNIGVNNISGVQNLTLYTVFAFGAGSTLLKYAAINGGFEDSNGNKQPDLQSEWDNNADGKPDTYYEATDGAELEQAIKDAFLSILKRASSGTAASVLASGEGQGANLVQAVFYPRRRIGSDVISWVGSLQNLWYHVDPFFTNSSMREETVSDSILNLTNDYIVQFYFDYGRDTTRAKLFADSNGDGAADTPATPTAIVDFDKLECPVSEPHCTVFNLWESGKILWDRDIVASPRTIYTTIDGSSFLAGGFSTTNKVILRPYLQASTDTEAEYIIRYLQGEGLTTVDLDNDGVNDIFGVDLVAPFGVDDYRERYAKLGSEKKVWKLGDILNSTPRIASWVQLNAYDSKYSDTTYRDFISTTSSSTPPLNYKGRGMVFAGGNDGMLHAFKLGTLELNWAGQTKPPQMAKLTGSDLGKEMWAFTPRNALPYLKYMMNPDYCHIYTVDLPPYIFDSSINSPTGCAGNYWECDKAVSSWRTIVIGGMRTGGACRGTSTACADVSGDSSKDCVNTPVDVGGNSVGYSSYFALDITDNLADPANPPTLLWEFSHPQLGFATPGPAVVRINASGDPQGSSKNGKWFVVFGSGPTGPISTTDWQFLARSDQNLRFFIFDLKNGPGANNANVIVKDTGIQYAFAGSMLNSTNDSDLDYQDDAIYIGYTKRTSSAPYTWNRGGVGRLVTKENLDPGQWAWSTVTDNIGPVTSSIARLQKNSGCFTSGGDEGCLWLFFGTGRYYYAQEAGIDDPDNQRRLRGLKEPCAKLIAGKVEIIPTCTTSVGSLTDVTSVGNAPSDSTANSSSFNGWYINLEASSTGFGAERNITDPLATTSGLLFFTTMKPYTDVCTIGGKSFIWATRYNTGGAPSSLKGVALLQVSTAAIEQVNLATAFTEQGGRRTSAMEGLPPTQQGLSLVSTPPPTKRVIHIRER